MLFSKKVYIPWKQKSIRHSVGKTFLLNIGPIRMYILMLGTRNVECRTNEGCTYVH